MRLSIKCSGLRLYKEHYGVKCGLNQILTFMLSLERARLEKELKDGSTV